MDDSRKRNYTPGNAQRRPARFDVRIPIWANLPKSHKMMDPRYRDVKSDQIPEVTLENGTSIRVICGNVGNKQGPVRDIVIDPEYLDVTVPAGSEFYSSYQTRTHSAGLRHRWKRVLLQGEETFFLRNGRCQLFRYATRSFPCQRRSRPLW